MSESSPPNSTTLATINNIVLSLIILLIFGVWGYAIFGAKGQVPVNKSAVAEEVQLRLEEHRGKIEQEAEQLVAELTPPLSEAVYHQIQEDSDLYWQELQQQSSTYVRDFDEMFIAAVKSEYRDYLQQHREVLAEEFPEHADKKSLDRLMAEFEQVGSELIDRYYLEDFAKESKRTREAWAKVKPLPPPAEGEPSLETQLLEYGTDWSVLALTDKAEQQVLSN
ncbi:hypothetical protein [Blastopirellula marina]|uniref:hypothetical protein n=1 Tax=Blastopirellula marina TaxID=124 RepID=UPI0011B082DC|nr:hypothetical protein [Blastopirellula marina]